MHLREDKLLTKVEIDCFRSDYPNVQEVSLLCIDMMGIPRGKLVGVDKLDKLTYPDSITLPKSVMLENSRGENDDIPIFSKEDPDYHVYGWGETLKPSLWSIPRSMIDEQLHKNPNRQQREEGWKELVTRGHLLIGLSDQKHSFVYGGRDLVVKMSELIKKEFGYTVNLAIELEFYLFNKEGNGSGSGSSIKEGGGIDRFNNVIFSDKQEGRNTIQSQCYGMEQVEAVAPLFDQVRAAMNLQRIELDGISSEYGGGQLEINLKHRPNPALACDDAVFLKHTLKSLSHSFDVYPTFMAVPKLQSSNGMHINLSLTDEKGENVLAKDIKGSKGTTGTTRRELNRTIHNLVGGWSSTVRDAMLIFAPNPNSYKRYYAQSFAPSNLENWGINNRTVTYRIPTFNENHPDFAKSMRLEHRAAGADTNPYLSVAAVLVGTYLGLKNDLSPRNEMVEGNAYDTPVGDEIPPSMSLSLQSWRNPDNILREFFGDDFFDAYYQHRVTEWLDYMGRLNHLDFDWFGHY